MSPGTSSILAAVGAVLLALAFAISSGLDHVALLLVTAAAATAIAATLVAPAAPGPAGSRIARAVLWFALAGSLVADLVFRPGSIVDPARLGAFRPLLGAAALVLATWLLPRVPGWLARARFPLLVILASALGAVVILASPAPGIDVWVFQQQGALGLLDGRNPYASLYRNIYGPGTRYLDPSLLTPDGHFIRAFPYMPLVLLLDAPFAWLGDVRWAMLAAAAAGAILIRALGRGARGAELAGALLLLQPPGFMVLEQSWIEPVVLATVLFAAWTVRRAAELPVTAAPATAEWLIPGLAAALAASSKQYAPLLLLPLLLVLPARARGKALTVAAGGAALLALPFLAWDASAFVLGVVEFQIRQPFRLDAMSWPAAIAYRGGPRLPSWPAFLLAGATLAVLLRGGMTTARALLAGAATWLVFVLFNKQAFCNYYWLAGGLLCAGLALLEAPAPPASFPSSASTSEA